MHPQFPLTEAERGTTPKWTGIPIVEVRAAAFFSPVAGMLQRKAAAIMVLSVTLFHVGIGWILYHLFHLLSPDVRSAFLASPEVHSTFIVAAIWVVGLLLLACLFVLRLIERQVTQPVAELARLSEAVASGELSVPFTPSGVNSEVGRLSRATSGMILALRRLANTMRASARDTTTLSAQISTTSESVAMAAQQTASTSSALSKESSLMARTIKEIADDAAKLEEISASLRDRAHENLRRERRLRTVAQENRARLDDSSRALELLTTDAGASAESIEALAIAVDEIRACRGIEQAGSGNDPAARQPRTRNRRVRQCDASSGDSKRGAERQHRRDRRRGQFAFLSRAPGRSARRNVQAGRHTVAGDAGRSELLNMNAESTSRAPDESATAKWPPE